MGPLASGDPGFNVTISSGFRSNTPYPTAAKSLITFTESILNSFSSFAPSMTNETFVMAHASFATGPATAKHAEWTSEGSTPASL